jgi:hypothetical protein
VHSEISFENTDSSTNFVNKSKVRFWFHMDFLKSELIKSLESFWARSQKLRKVAVNFFVFVCPSPLKKLAPQRISMQYDI